MTIKQQGGVFGRNPTFNDVDVEGTLTVGGAYTLPTTDGTIGQVLTTDGAGAVTFSAAGGGGGTYTAGTGLSLTGTVFANTDPDQTVSLTQGGATTISGTYPNFTISSTDTNTTYTAGTGLALTGTVFSNTITNNNQLTNGAAYVDNAGVDTHLNTGTATTGEVLSWTGSDYDWIAAGGGSALELYAENPSTPTAPSATGANAVAIGDQSVSAGTRSVTLGNSRASGTDSFAAAIANNTSSYGATAVGALALGPQAKTSSAYGVAIGYNAKATNFNTLSLGSLCDASANQAISIGYYSEANANKAVAIGNQALASTIGKFAYAAGPFVSAGDAQSGMYMLRTATTDATATALSTDGSAAGTNDQVILPNNSAYFFSGTIIARQDAATGTDVGAWEIKGAIRREANAASTVLIKSTIDDFNVPTGWAVALTADTTNGGLAITVTGAAATNIRWVATVNTSEVTY